MRNLNRKELLEIKGGNPILVGLGVLTTMISLGKAADQAGQWFMQGWNNPK
ncbi:MAG: hypothetical protein WBV45_05175 [Lutimonas sp.]